MAAGDEQSPREAPRRWLDDPEGASPVTRRLLSRARPHRVPVGRKQRVWRGLQASGTGGRVSSRRFQFVGVAIVLVLAGAARARAHWLGTWVSSTYQALFSSDHVATGPGRSMEKTQVTHQAPPSPPSPPPPPPTRVDLPPSSDEAVRAPASRSVRGGGSLTTRSVRVGAAEEDDMALLLAAARAIRVESDPAGARAMLAQYLRKHPHGRFAEEAFAMSIEAAALTHDSSVARLAARYLALYPTGAFRDTALRLKSGTGASR